MALEGHKKTSASKRSRVGWKEGIARESSSSEIIIIII
jgi:hypothetical protein